MRRSASLTVLALIFGSLTIVATAPPSAAAVDPCGPSGNAISCENSKPGSPKSAWEISRAGDADIQGFSTDISVNAGSRIDFKIDTDASAYSITIFRMGWYGGDGARQVATVTPSATLPQAQPNCITDATTGETDCGNWAVSASWNVPSDAVSGVYIAHLYRADDDDESNITFIVRNDDSHSDVVFQTSDPTWEAYNTYGGADFYTGAAAGRAYKVSYNRPMLARTSPGGQDFFMANEYPLVRFLERNGYDVSYLAGVDTDRYGSLLLNHKVFLSVGHDEYWSGAQRANVEAARDAGVNLQFLSGNEVYWRTRYEASADPSHTAYRTLVCYKEAWSQAKIDPSPESTSTWRDPRYSPKSQGGGLPENQLTGTIFMSNYTDLPLTVTKAEGQLRLWRNTGLAGMTGASTALAPHTVGYESDEDQDNGFREPGLIDLSTTVGQISGQYMQDYGLHTADGTTTHSITLYRAPSGALVFGAGSVQWTWGLDEDHDSPYAPEPADPRMQQAEVNLLADMGAQPTTLMAGLAPAAASTDTTGPSVTIDSPAAGAPEPNGARVTVSGTATDAGGGVVAGVEYSADGGTSWHPAKGTDSWTFTYTQHGIGSTPLKVRAVDDSANIGQATTRSFAVACPCSVFGNATPGTLPTSVVGTGTLAASDSSPVELGMRFTPSVDGYVSGVRFYKGAGNVGTHVGSLWSAAGQKLAGVTFSGESDSGWQQATFTSPVPVSAGTTYVVSYTAPSGHYADQNWAFGESGVDAYPLSVAGGFGATPAGVYGTAGKFPSSSYMIASYAVDAMFTTTDDSPLVATNQWPVPGASSVSRSTTIGATFSKPVDPASVAVSVKDANGNAVDGSANYDGSTRTVTFTPAASLAGFVKYSVTLSAQDTQGNAVTTGKTWSFTSAAPQGAPGVCPCSLFSDDTTPGTLEVPDAKQVTLGVKVTPAVSGTITGVRFYKGVDNTGTHLGTLWSADGTKLAEGTFTGESSTGWETLSFASPVAVTAGTTYVASYTTDVGLYSATANGFAAANLSYGPLSVTSTAGTYVYGIGFPSHATSTNYLVDVVFQKTAPVLAVSVESPADGSVDVPRATPASISFTDTLAAGSTMTATSGGTAVPGTSALDSTGTTLTFQPSDLWPADADVTISVAGITGSGGGTLPTQTWTFHTRAPDSPTAVSLFSDQVPQTVSETDSSPVEVGTAFVPSRDGAVTGIRFYKGPGNGGSHVGHLWTANGQLLATVNFTGESANGWQSATVSPSIRVTAGTRYVVSYLAPQGHYSDTPGFFRSTFVNGVLSAPSGSNGLYLYGAAGGFPQYSYNSTNYFVDVVFEPDLPTIAVTAQSPADGSSGVSRATNPSISFSAPIASGYTMTLAQGATPIPGNVLLSTDQKTLTFNPSSSLPADVDITATVSGVTSTDGATLPSQTWTFHTEAAPDTVSLFTGQTPATRATTDSAAVEVGTVFSPTVNGTITRIRFFKGVGNTGTHTGSIWSSTGTLLARVTFTNETASGWQEATLPTPLAVTAATTYLVSYYAPNGHYSATSGYFKTAYTAGPLTAPAGNNGRYRYVVGGGFPTTSYNSSNYFVDIAFQPTN